MCYYFIINSKNLFPPHFLRQGTTKILKSFFSTKLFAKVFSTFFCPSQDIFRESILSNLSFRERAFLQKRVQRYRTISIKQIITTFFRIILRTREINPGLFHGYTLYYIVAAVRAPFVPEPCPASASLWLMPLPVRDCLRLMPRLRKDCEWVMLRRMSSNMWRLRLQRCSL